MTTTPEKPTSKRAPAGDEAATQVLEPAADESAASDASGASGGGDLPKLADGIELMGEYEDSGFKEPHYVAKRADDQILQLSRMLHVIAEQADGRRDYAEIATLASEELERDVSADNVRFLVEKKLRPLGVLAAPDGSSPELRKSDPLLALKFRAAVVPAWLTRTLTSFFRLFFLPPVVLAVIAGLVAVDVWFFFIHGVGQSTRQLVYQPILLLMVLGLVVIATALHEIGHASALRYGGAEPGVMGAGIYIVWPAFYTDVTDAYRLGRGGRLRTDVGGIYFNALFVLGIVGVYFLTGFEPILVLIIIQHMQIIQQLLPFLRLDGYYILSDLTGVPDMFSRIKPTLKSMVPGKETEKSVKELKPWVRVVTTAWIIFLIPVLLGIFGLMIFNAPRMVATAYDSFWLQTDKIQSGGALNVISGVIQTLALVLPLAGFTYTFAKVLKAVVRGAWNWSEGSVVRRGIVATTTTAVAALALFVLFPNGDYRPIQPGETGTIQGGLAQFSNVGTGRPALTEEREEELGGAPTARSLPEEERAEFIEQEDVPPTATTPTSTSTTTTPTETTPTETTPSTTTPTDSPPSEPPPSGGTATGGSAPAPAPAPTPTPSPSPSRRRRLRLLLRRLGRQPRPLRPLRHLRRRRPSRRHPRPPKRRRLRRRRLRRHHEEPHDTQIAVAARAARADDRRPRCGPRGRRHHPDRPRRQHRSGDQHEERLLAVQVLVLAPQGHR